MWRLVNWLLMACLALSYVKPLQGGRHNTTQALQPHTQLPHDPLYIFITQDGNIYRSNGYNLQFLYNVGTTIVSGHQALVEHKDLL